MTKFAVVIGVPEFVESQKKDVTRKIQKEFKKYQGKI